MIDTLFPKSLFPSKTLVLPNIHAGFATFQKIVLFDPVKKLFFSWLAAPNFNPDEVRIFGHLNCPGT